MYSLPVFIVTCVVPMDNLALSSYTCSGILPGGEEEVEEVLGGEEHVLIAVITFPLLVQKKNKYIMSPASLVQFSL